MALLLSKRPGITAFGNAWVISRQFDQEGDVGLLSPENSGVGKIVAGIRIPDTPVAIMATELAFAASPRWLFNHLLRTYLFAELLARRNNEPYDSELLFLGCVLHDLGLTEKFVSTERTEVDSADAAMDFLLSRGVAPERVSIVWDAIALHTSRGIYDRKQPEIALVGLGALLDNAGIGIEHISTIQLQAVLDKFPRLRFKTEFPKLLGDVVQKKPKTAYGTLAADLLRARGMHVPTVIEALAAAPFGE